MHKIIIISSSCCFFFLLCVTHIEKAEKYYNASCIQVRGKPIENWFEISLSVRCPLCMLFVINANEWKINEQWTNKKKRVNPLKKYGLHRRKWRKTTLITVDNVYLFIFNHLKIRFNISKEQLILFCFCCSFLPRKRRRKKKYRQKKNNFILLVTK